MATFLDLDGAMNASLKGSWMRLRATCKTERLYVVALASLPTKDTFPRTNTMLVAQNNWSC